MGGLAGRGPCAVGGLHAGSKLQGNCETLMTAAAGDHVKARAGKKLACLAERTDDWAYGQSAAASLVTSNPRKAIDNADSHEYFGENTPSSP